MEKVCSSPRSGETNHALGHQICIIQHHTQPQLLDQSSISDLTLSSWTDAEQRAYYSLFLIGMRASGMTRMLARTWIHLPVHLTNETRIKSSAYSLTFNPVRFWRPPVLFSVSLSPSLPQSTYDGSQFSSTGPEIGEQHLPYGWHNHTDYVMITMVKSGGLKSQCPGKGPTQRSAPVPAFHHGFNFLCFGLGGNRSQKFLSTKLSGIGIRTGISTGKYSHFPD